jgi:hypothetical protein
VNFKIKFLKILKKIIFVSFKISATFTLKYKQFQKTKISSVFFLNSMFFVVLIIKNSTTTTNNPNNINYQLILNDIK